MRMEVGDKVEITCVKTGLSAQIEFNLKVSQLVCPSPEALRYWR